jgi:hypothetical protein
VTVFGGSELRANVLLNKSLRSRCQSTDLRDIHEGGTRSPDVSWVSEMEGGKASRRYDQAPSRMN